jgi:cytochrome P450
MGTDDPSLIRRLVDEQILRPEEIPAAVAVVMFGAIETSEGMTANALWHLLSHPRTLERVRADRALVPAAIDESLRLEPAATWIDRYTTSDFTFGGAAFGARDLVTISLLGANRDPAVFEEPDRFDIDRPNVVQHVTFAQGPHTCIGLHVARAETNAAINAVLDQMPNIELDAFASSAPEGLIFRKAVAVVARA